MELQPRHISHDLEHVEPVTAGADDDGDQQQHVESANINVSYGIHHGRYPIGGMTVRDARRTLQNLINIDESAVAVIHGSPVEESERISADVSMISFVKPSAMKG